MLLLLHGLTRKRRTMPRQVRKFCIMQLRCAKSCFHDARIKLTAALCSMVAVLTGCSSQVYSDLYTYEYDPLPRDSVAVVAAGDSTIDNALVIGKVIVSHTAVGTQQQYDRVLFRAIDEAARYGGNLLVVEQLAPANGKQGTWATIARSSKPVRTVTAPSFSSLAETSDRHTASTQNLKTGKQGSSQSHTSQPSGCLKFNVGPMWNTSKIYYSDNGDFKRGVSGVAFDASIANMGGGWYGYGFDFYGYHATMEGRKTGGRQETFDFTQFYIGLALVIGGQLADRLRINTSIGLGLGIHTNSGDSEAGVAFRSTVGLEYMVSHKIGIGLDLVSQRLLLTKPEGFNLADDEFYGFQQLGFMPGLRVYF